MYVYVYIYIYIYSRDAATFTDSRSGTVLSVSSAQSGKECLAEIILWGSENQEDYPNLANVEKVVMTTAGSGRAPGFSRLNFRKRRERV